MDRSQEIHEQLTAFALHLAARREAITQAWRKAVDADGFSTGPGATIRK